MKVSESPVVLDTNVFIAAAFRPGSDSATIVEKVRSGSLRMIWNEQTRREIEYIVRKIPPLNWESFVDLFREENCWHGDVFPERFEHVPDEDDRKFAALAKAAGAVLISMDEHLLGSREQGQVDILTPGEYLNR